MATVTAEERKVIRELAKQLKDASQRPEMKQREQLWKAHNDLKTKDPVVAVFPEMSWAEIIPAESLKCESEATREIEWYLRAKLFRANVIDDDIPVTDIWECRKVITNTGWNKQQNKKGNLFANDYVIDGCLGSVPLVWTDGFFFDGTSRHYDPIIEEPEDLSILGTPEIIYEEKESLEKLKLHQDLLGDILDVRHIGMKHLQIELVKDYADYRGLEELMYDIYEEPEMLHEAMAIMAEGYNSMLDQYMAQGLLNVNGGQAYSGSGGQTYTAELPNDDSVCTDLKDFFGMAESQEFTMVGPKQHWEFVQKYEKNSGSKNT